MNGQQNRAGGRFLEQHSHLENIEYQNILEGQIRECYGRVAYTHKTHEKCADILLANLARIKFIQIVLSGLCTAGGLIYLIINSFGIYGVALLTIASTILLVLNIFTKDIDLGELAQKHRQAASEIWYIREKYLSLLTDIRVGSKTLNEIQSERDTLLTDLHNVYSGAPSTNFKAYNRAKESLKFNEEMTFSDEEIDCFLPQVLRKNKDL